MRVTENGEMVVFGEFREESTANTADYNKHGIMRLNGEIIETDGENAQLSEQGNITVSEVKEGN